jgi:hypothetical protein
MAVGGVPLRPHSNDIVLELLFRNFSVVVMKVGQEFEARDVSEACDGVLHGGKKDAGYCGDEEVAQDGIYVVPHDEIEAEGLVLPIVFGDLRLGGLVLVCRIDWWFGWCDEFYVTLAA